jgi:hypothetical protein
MTKSYVTANMTSEILEIKNQFLALQKKYQKYLPKVDPELIDDLLLRLMENPREQPLYLIEVFTQPGVDVQRMRELHIAKTGVAPAIYDIDAYYAAHHRLTLEMLNEISQIEGIIEITGEYTDGIGNYAASYEYRLHDKKRVITAPASYNESGSSSASALRQEFRPTTSYESARQGVKNYKVAIYTAIGIVSAIALAGFIIGAGFFLTQALTSPTNNQD